jgi:small subunit ribosomal protein S20
LALRRFLFEQRFFRGNEESMANTPQAKKRIRRNATRETINHSRISRIRTFIKAAESAIAEGKKTEAAEALKKAQPELFRGVARGIIHKNTAARKFSRLSKRLASLG